MIYLDTSAAVPMFVPEPASESVDAWYEACTEPLLASDWMRTEFASALALKERRGELTARQVRSAWKNFSAFCGTGIRLHPVSRRAFESAADLVLGMSGLRSGDALHLAIALEAGAIGLATADTVQGRFAAEKGLAVTIF